MGIDASGVGYLVYASPRGRTGGYRSAQPLLVSAISGARNGVIATMEHSVRRRRKLSVPLLTILVAPWVPGGAFGQGSPLGGWDLRVEWPGRTTEVVLTVQRIEGELVASWRGPQGEIEACSVEFVEDVLSFVLSVESQEGTEIEVRYEGRVEGEKILGTIFTPSGREIKAHGRRRKRETA